MKKGCFVKFIVIFTILLGAAIYVVEKKFDEFIFKPGKEIIIEELLNEWDESLPYISNSPEKDSLKALIVYYLKNIESVKELTSEGTEKISNYFEKAVADSIISRIELNKLSELITQEINDAKRTQNRN